MTQLEIAEAHDNVGEQATRATPLSCCCISACTILSGGPVTNVAEAFVLLSPNAEMRREARGIQFSLHGAVRLLGLLGLHTLESGMKDGEVI
jgi:hypothetical protein